jgi:hypothetical protein
MLVMSTCPPPSGPSPSYPPLQPFVTRVGYCPPAPPPITSEPQYVVVTTQFGQGTEPTVWGLISGWVDPDILGTLVNMGALAPWFKKTNRYKVTSSGWRIFNNIGYFSGQSFNYWWYYTSILPDVIMPPCFPTACDKYSGNPNY